MAEVTAEAPTKPPVETSDAIWASFLVPFPPTEVQNICRNLEVLFRLNPYYYFDDWRSLGDGSFHAEFENHSNHTHLKLDLDVEWDEPNNLTVRYTGGIKKRTVFTIEAAPVGSRVTITDDYDLLPTAEREARNTEVDKSLNAWAEALRVYFQRLKRWSRVPGWHWYLHRYWMPMKPSSRRIVWLLFLITTAEFFFFLFVMLIYVLELNK